MDKTLTYADHTVFYRVVGSGNPVVLLHGVAEDGEIWNRQAAFLQGNHQLIIPDMPGSGKSAPSNDLSMEALAGSVKAILDAEAINEAIVIGHSMGGYVTLAFAEKFPQLLKAFGLFHSTSYADNDEKKTSRNKNITFIQKHGTYEYLKQSTSNLFSDDFKKEHPDQVSSLIEQYKHFNPLSLIAYMEAMRQRPDRTAVLKSFVKPILFIIGKYDNVIPFADSLEICHLPALSYIYILEKSGHMGMMEELEKSNNILMEFLNECALKY